MSKIKTVKELGIKRMNLNVPIELHTTVLLKFIEAYVDKHSSTKPKRRRA